MIKPFQTAMLLLLAGPLLIAQEAQYPPPIGKRLTGGIVPHVEEVEHPVDAKTLRQPPELEESIRKMQQGTLAQRIAALKEKTLRDLVYMKGGRFWMGDFGQWHSEEGLPYTSDTDNKPPFEVELDGFSIGKYKVTYAEFNVFTDATQQPRVTQWGEEISTWRNPTGVTWFQAKAYCQWLSKQTGLPIDLPTEAQWEYAARSGGKPIVFPTDNGCSDEGRNIPISKQIDAMQADDTGLSGRELYPVGIFPPSPMGLYDLGGDGREWVGDWYGSYPQTPGIKKNPKGPDQGTQKVQRCDANGHFHARMTFERFKMPPADEPYEGRRGMVTSQYNDCFRIAVLIDKPITHQ